MARLETLEPMAFARLKRWMGSLKNRDALKRRRDVSQAEVVEETIKQTRSDSSTTTAHGRCPTRSMFTQLFDP